MKTSLKLMAAILAVVVIAVVGFVADANLKIAANETLPPDFGAPGRFVTVAGHNLHVATVGDPNADLSGAPLLLLHGFGVQGHAAWLPWASKLAANRSLIMPDLLGFGHSDRVTVPGPHYTLKNQAATVAAILDGLGVDKADIVGNALGGAVAAQFALDYPARVRRIVFMDAAVYSRPFGEPRTGLHFIDRAITWQMQTGGPRADAAHACKDQPNCRWMRLARVQGTTDAVLAMEDTERNADAEGSRLSANIPNIGAPSLVIWGGNDKVTPVTDGDRLAQNLKTTISIVADAGNMPYVTQPDRIARRILDFLEPASMR